jgi:signal transduction histidine kinase
MKTKKKFQEYFEFKVRINDLGCGTTEEELRRILKPFFQFSTVEGVEECT